MTTPSQAAFQKSHNSRYSNCSYKTTQNGYFDASTQLDFENYLAGVEFGRKQALEEVRKDAAWQPIETAPKDGTAILAIVSGVDSDGLAYEPSTVQIDGTQVHLFCDSDDDSWTELSEWELTHWMPLPKPPIAIQELLT